MHIFVHFEYDTTLVLEKIRAAHAALRRSEKKVAEQVLQNPDHCVEASIQHLAQLAGVSEPTVIRFCHALDCEGFQDFKLKLARSIASREQFFFRDVARNDSSAEIANKLIDSAIASMVHIRNQLNHQALAQAVDMYCAAERVEFYGSGGSALVAEDAQLKFFRLGKPAIAYADPHIQQASAALLDKKSLAIAISYTGRNRDVLESVHHAIEAGAPVVSVTCTGSPLSALSDVNLNVDLIEDSDMFSPLKSRLAQMIVLDILAVGIALRGGDAMLKQLARSSNAISHKFVETDAVHSSDADSQLRRFPNK